ncbi:MAG: hypothetical protein LBO81_03955, partial [Clostridiales Family XIII bacterium]|nr:hypothetical protein [Clostridiales Family XIII bacterium]
NPLAAAGADDATADDASGRDAALEDASAFVYTANVSAAGTIQGLCTLLDRVADMPGVRIASYSYGGSGAARSEKERMQLVFKVYVLVEDDAQTDSGESAADAAG